jgi:hypothetical protein
MDFYVTKSSAVNKTVFIKTKTLPFKTKILSFKTKTKTLSFKTKTIILVLEVPRDQDQSLENYSTRQRVLNGNNSMHLFSNFKRNKPVHPSLSTLKTFFQ